jgi:hypothetical protein
MRVTVQIDDDVLEMARRLAAQQGQPLEHTIVDLIREELRLQGRCAGSSFPVFQTSDGARRITLDTVKQTEEDV